MHTEATKTVSLSEIDPCSGTAVTDCLQPTRIIRNNFTKINVIKITVNLTFVADTVQGHIAEARLLHVVLVCALVSSYNGNKAFFSR